jgi:hypothetical protein
MNNRQIELLALGLMAGRIAITLGIILAFALSR